MMLGRALVFSALSAASLGAQSPEGLSLTLNLPSYRLEVWDGPERIRTYWTTIGLPEHPTPTGTYQLSRIEWNPSWTPPDSPWAKGKKRIAPGRGNPMGRAKLQFDDLLYIHGTWRPNELGGPYSHGCVRVKNEDVLDLARLIALRTGALSEKEIDRLERNPGRTRSVRLPVSIPVRIRYGLTEEVGGEIVQHEDPYGWGDRDPAVPIDAGAAAEPEETIESAAVAAPADAVVPEAVVVPEAAAPAPR